MSVWSGESGGMEGAQSEKEADCHRGSLKGTPAGILRFDLGKLRTSMDLKLLSQEPSSPQPSVDRLSVTFADESLKSDNSQKAMDKVHFPPLTDEENSEEEDYSASVTAIMQRRASTRRSKRRSGRRGSSPFSPDILPETENGRRRSSVFTTSSGDTAITMEDSFTPSVTQEQIFENIKLHKEVLSSVKMQPWNMRKKLRLVIQAKSYIKKHEGALQERLAQSHSTRDMLARCNIYLIKKWQHCKREAANMSKWLIPWELRIKEIESHFGSVVASYFIFLRWLFWVNIVIAAILIAFVAVPEMLTADFAKDLERKSILPEDKYNSTNFLTLWDFEGIFKYSPMFYGWYTKRDTMDKGYRLPLAYFFTGLAVYVYSFVATLRKMAKNSRMSKLSEKEDECIFTWKLFTGWDYMIGNAETAHNRVASIVMSFKEALLEEAEKKREDKNWKIIGSRVLVNIAVLGLLALSALTVVTVVARSNEKEANSGTWRRNEITIVMSLISITFPILFEMLGYCEHLHPRKQLRLQLARIMVLNLLNLYSLIFALFGKINNMSNQLQSFKPNGSDDLLTIKLPSIPTQMTFTSSEMYNKTCYSLCDNDNLAAAGLIGVAALSQLINKTTQKTDWDFSFISDSALEMYDNIMDESKYDTTTVDELFSTIAPAITQTKANTQIETNTQTEAVTQTISTTQIEITTQPKSRCRTYCIGSADSSNISTNLPEPTLTLNITYEEKIPIDYKNRTRLRSLCWETMFGQELVKLTVMDLVMTVVSTLGIDFCRGLVVRYLNSCWCWDLEKRFPQYGDFKVAENILHLVNNQGMVWMGMFFSPGLVVLNVVKLIIMMYLRSWAVLTCNVPHEIIFRASRSNNFYFALLLMMLFLVVLPVGYTIVWLEPSWHCGPFSSYNRIFHIFTKTIKKALPESFHDILNYIASPGIVIPLLVLLVLIIYYLISLTNALREANNDLKIQLRRERTEERRKMFQIADRRRRGGSDGSADPTPFGKWKKLLSGFPGGGKSFDDTTPKDETPEDKPARTDSKKVISKFILKALKNRKQSVVSEDDAHQDDATDTEQHDSLPDDAVSLKEIKAKRQRPKLESIDDESTIKNKVSKNDSVGSNWSENIPVITISKTESSECILETKTLDNIDKIKIEKTVDDTKPRIKYVLKKQVSSFESDTNKDVKLWKNSGTSDSVKTNDTIRTESSTEYKETSLSN